MKPKCKDHCAMFKSKDCKGSDDGYMCYKPDGEVQQIGDKIEKKCREHITTNGERFYISWAEVLKILDKYGYIAEIPF